MYLKLYYSPTSPYARKALVVAKELKLSDSIEVITTNPLESASELVKINPLSKVPALIRDDGFELYDSPLICEYLFFISDVVNRKGLYGSKDGCSDSYFTIQCQHALADGVMDATFSLVMERKRALEHQSELWVKRWLLAIERGLREFGEFDRTLMEPLTVGSIATCCALGYLNLRTPDIRWQEEYPALDDWYQTMLQRDSLKDTDPCIN
ncbi:glutathione S-transferase [Pseudomonadota bacterium]